MKNCFFSHVLPKDLDQVNVLFAFYKREIIIVSSSVTVRIQDGELNVYPLENDGRSRATGKSVCFVFTTFK